MNLHCDTSRIKSYLQNISSYGVAFLFISVLIVHCAFAQWSTDTATTKQLSPFGVNIDACADSDGGCYIAFTNFSYVKTRYYLQKINRFGYTEWATPAMIGDTANLHVRGRLTLVKNFHGVVAAYYAQSVKETIQARIIYTGKLFLQKIDDTGKLMWGTNGVRASVDTFNQDGFEYPTVIPDDSGGVFVMWVDKRHDGTDVRGSLNVQRISPDGKRLWGDYGVQIIDTLGNNMPVWEKTINGVVILFVSKTETKLTKVDYDGNPVWTTMLSSESGKGFSQMTSDKLGNIYLGGRKNVEQSFLLLTFILRKIGAEGSTIWGEDLIIADSIGNGSTLYEVKEIENDKFQLFIAWKPVGEKSRIQFIDSEGSKLLPDSQTIVSDNYSSNSIQCVVQPDTSSVIVLISDNRTGEQLYYGQKILLNGEKQWNANDILLTTYKADNNQIVIRDVITDSQGGIIAIGSIEPHWGIYGIQVNKYGVLGSVITKVSGLKNLPPDRFELFQNYPNPFNPRTTITYSLPERADIELLIYNVLGQRVALLIKEKQEQGTYNVEFDGMQLSSGIYFYRLTADINIIAVKKMILTK